VTTATEKAVERIERDRKRDSGAVRLVRLASLAVRIEPHLLRRLRVDLLPELDVGTEADVWFSPMVESRGAYAIVLDAHVADVLREDLASDRELLRHVHRITEEAHRNAPPTVRLEEDLNARALLNEGDVTAAIDEALRPAIRAIYEGGERAREIAHWVRRAMPRLHRTVVRTPSALSLLLASDSLLGSRPQGKTPDSGISADAVGWILSPDERVPRMRLGMELLQRGVRFVAPTQDSRAIELPQTRPALVELEWTQDGHRVKTLIEAEAGRTVDLDEDISAVTVRTLAGDEYVIERVQTDFRSDIFVSYAQLDNQPLVEGRGGWVANLHRALETRLRQLRGEEVTVWRDPKLQGNDAFDEDLVDRLQQSAVFVAVVSPRYLKSEWCRREVEAFLKASTATGGVTVGDSSRLFKILKTPVSVEQQPRALQTQLGYEFFKTDPETGRVRELDEVFGPDAQREFWIKLDDLAHDIADVLDKLARPAGSSPSPIAAPGRTIYLAETTSDLRERREAIKSDLLQRGLTVLPELQVPLSEPDCSTFVREQLARCTLSVHLIGRHYGFVPEGSNDSIVVLQHDLAVDRGLTGNFGRLIWLPPELKFDDERQRRVVAGFEDDPRRLTGAELVKAPFSEFMAVLHERLNPEPDQSPPVEPSHAKLIYLICDRRDTDAVRPLMDVLFKAGEVVLPTFEGDEADIRETHEEYLRECDAALIYYGAGNELWLRRKMRELQKSAGYGRQKPLLATAVYVGPPMTPEKARFRTHDAILIAGSDSGGVSDEALRPFLDRWR